MGRMVLLVAAALGLSGCCSDEPAQSVGETPVRVADEARIAPDAAPAQPPSAGLPLVEGSDVIADNSEPIATGEATPLADADEVPKQLPVDVLWELDDDKLTAKLAAAGWKTGKPKAIETGSRWTASRQAGTVTIELTRFKTNELADTYMFAAEKRPGAVIGRNNTKVLVVWPSKGDDRSESQAALSALMSPAEPVGGGSSSPGGSPAAAPGEGSADQPSAPGGSPATASGDGPADHPGHDEVPAEAPQ